MQLGQSSLINQITNTIIEDQTYFCWLICSNIVFSFRIFYFKIYFFVFYGFNIYHVTMQSIGVCKLYNKKTEEIQYQTSFIFISNILFFFFGLFRFYIPIINNQNIFLLSSFTIILILIIFIYQLYKYRSLSNSLTTLTGSIIFLPILFVDKPIHAILLGVTMHYSQYIFISSKVLFWKK